MMLASSKAVRCAASIVAVVLAAALAACSAPARRGNEVIERQVRFTCSNGEEVEMRFFPQQGVAVLVRHGVPIELQQQPSGSGFVYSNGPNTVRGKSDELTVEIGRMVPLQCKAARGAKQSGAANDVMALGQRERMAQLVSEHGRHCG